MPEVKNTPLTLKPFTFHGVDLQWGSGPQAIGECPFCGRDSKFTVQIGTSKWRCLVCQTGSDKGGGNALTFLRVFHKHCVEAVKESELEELAQDRKLLGTDSLRAWGVVKSTLTGDWLIPSYNALGNLCQLYSYRENWQTKKSILFPTPGELGSGLFLPVAGYDPEKPYVDCLEGPWDAIAYYEMLGQVKETEDGLALTGSECASLLAQVNVVAVPGCGAVGTPFEKWLPLFSGKKVRLFFDNDHPREENGKHIDPAAYLAYHRAFKLLAGAESPPESVEYVRWGGDKCEPSLPHGYDVRDILSKDGNDPRDRLDNLRSLYELLQPAPKVEAKREGEEKSQEIQPLFCREWSTLVQAWRKPLSWRQELADALAVMLAVAVSTVQKGDQLFLQLIASAGSAKTRFCDAMLVSSKCYALEHITGFHSGWKDSSGEDFSLLSRINRKTLITPEGDVLMSSPKFAEIMSQQRRIFDGTSGASYKNRKEDLRYTGLRTPWIIAGTPALLDSDQASLGDRFLRFFIDQPSDDEKQNILRRVGFSALRAVRQTSNCRAESCVEDTLLMAYRLTGGYVDYLRDNAEELLNQVDMDEEAVVDYCSALAEFTADMRARPHKAKDKETHDTKEMPTRLLHQFVRLALCLAVTLNKKTVDRDVLRIVKKVALDTASGRHLTVVKRLYEVGPEGCHVFYLAKLTGESDERERHVLRFLKKIHCVVQVNKSIKTETGKMTTARVWRLTDRLRRLYEVVFPK